MISLSGPSYFVHHPEKALELLVQSLVELLLVWHTDEELGAPHVDRLRCVCQPLHGLVYRQIVYGNASKYDNGADTHLFGRLRARRDHKE